MNILDKIRVVVRDGLREEEQEHYIKALNNLHERWKSPIMKVAVIGEFNSGKSTFINALIQQNLLKSKCIRTTASAVTLSMDSTIRSVSCQVTMKDDFKCVIPQSNGSDASAYFKRKYGVTFSDVQEFIDLISAEQKVAQDVRTAHIALPASEQGDTLALPSNIHIIDTPGYDPGDDSEVKHSEVTKAVVRDEADLALVLMPVGHAMPKDLITFLSDHVRDYLHRCIFVITKTDILDEDDPVQMANFVRDTLQKSFSLSNPLVYTVAAGKVLPGKNVDAEAKNDFLSFRKKLLERLSSCREEVITEHVLRLSKDLATSLAESLKKCEIDLKNTEKNLEHDDVKSIEETMGRELKQCLTEFENDHKSMYNNWKSQIEKKWRDLRVDASCFAIVDEDGNVDKFKRDNLPRIERYIKVSCKEMINIIQKKEEEMDELIQGLQNRLLKHFEKNYLGMPALQSPSFGTFSQIDKIVIRVYIPRSSIESACWPSWIFGIDIDKAKRAVAEQIRKSYNKVLGSIETAIENGYNERRNALIQLVNDHIKRYGKDVETLINEQTNKKNKCNAQIQSNRELQNSLSSLISEITDSLNEMKQI